MELFCDMVKDRSYVSNIKKKHTVKENRGQLESKQYSKLISMDDLTPPKLNRPKRASQTTFDTNKPTENKKPLWQSQDWLNEGYQINTAPTKIVQNGNGYTQNEIHSNDNHVESIFHSRTASSAEDLSPTAMRTRDHTVDSLSFVKITPAIGKFEDLKSEAMNSWTEGVDVQLDSNAKTKKKAEWLSQSAFFSDNIDIHLSKESAKNQTYVEVADKQTPAWAIDTDNKYNSNLYQQSKAWPQPQQQIQPVMMTYIPMANNYPIMPSPKDNELMLYLYSITCKPTTRSVLQHLEKRVASILLQSLHEISQRTFALLLEALIILLEYEVQQSKTETARKIHNVWNHFSFHLTRFIQTYANLPNDLKSILKFTIIMNRFFHEIDKDLPMNDILRIYDNMKTCIPIETNNELIKLLRQLNIFFSESDSNESWHDLDDALPDVPTAEVIISEVINKVHSLHDYEAKKDMTITNMVHHPWPNMDLKNYALVHFMLLRDELVGSIQRVIKDLFKGKTVSEIQVPECAIYENTEPKSTSLMVSSSEPCIIFSLGKPRVQDQLMEDLNEGSLVILLPEIAISGVNNIPYTKKKVAETSLIGHVIRANTCFNSKSETMRMVSIHIHKTEVSKIEWSSQYTIITTNINATSTMSILNWLHSQYVELNKKHFSPILTPRILGAKNILSQGQLNCLDEEFYEHAVSTNNNPAPTYIQGVEIDISCIMAKNGHFHARPSNNVWPRLPSQWDQVVHTKRPALYCVSPSQLDAIKFALTHRIAVISGASGTGKTYLASKLAQLLSEALRVGQFHQPVLIITKSQSTLDQILSNMVSTIPDMIRFGGEPFIESLMSKQAIRLAAPSVSDNNFRQYQILEKQLGKNQSKLMALFKARYQASRHDPVVLSTAVAPAYLQAMTKHDPHSNQLMIWKLWAQDDEMTRTYSSEELDTLSNAQWMLENTYLRKGGHGIMPIIEPSVIKNRFSWVANNPSYISSIVDAVHWPFDTSVKSGAELRSALLGVWKKHPAEKIWLLSKSEKTELISSLSNVLVSFIDSEIEDVLQSQIKTAQTFDEILISKLTYLCRFNRVIGMTADFAAAHRDWVSTLWPRAVIVDEASDILESTLVSSLLGPRTEHIILLGSNDNANKPRITNPSLAGNNRYLDTSLFERWKGSANEFALLEEQWYMHSQVATVVDKFNSTKLEKSALLITAPVASCSENMVDGRQTNLEPLFGITQRAFYVDYQSHDAVYEIDAQHSKYLKTPVTFAEVDEARFVAFFAVYLSQQPYHTTSITILTLTYLQKYLIRQILKEEVPKRTCFKSKVNKICVDVVEQYMGRHNNFVIVSTATPGHSSSSYDNISPALTRARYGLFIVGKPGQDKVHSRWNDFAKYMEERELYGPAIQLTCHVHGDTVFAGCWKDFNKMKNGGCQRLCDTLMSDGHVCKEECHFLSHDEIICQEPCNRLRPSNCTHTCRRKCFECAKEGVCPPCMIETKTLLNCGHEFKDVCHKLQQLNSIQCKEIVHVNLPCGHTEPVECYQSTRLDQIQCTKQALVKLNCGHSMMQSCGMDAICTEICNQNLECGHKCVEVCGVSHTHDRSRCTASCPKQLICGHQCAKGCANPDEHTERCLEKCNYKCSHQYRCSRECWRDCIRCVSECPYRCEHFKCKKKCFEICDRPPCNSPCQKRLQCSHKCAGLCGEPCPPCKICSSHMKCSISLRSLSEFEKNELVYMLPECGCVYSVESLDMYFENQAKNGEHTAIKLWECPTCKQTIYTALRYNRYIKTEIALVNEIKLKMEHERQQLTQLERNQIIKAMNSETKRHAIHNIVGGRWFVCPNKHPYYVGDCGGATEVSKCPECDALIGGTGHKVVESNRFYGEFDGSEKPAWPGQPGVL